MIKIQKSLPIIMCIVSAFLCLALATQNRDLKVALETSERLAARSYEAEIGSLMGTISGRTLDGEKQTIDFGSDGRAALVGVFSPNCPVCKDNWTHWQSLFGPQSEDEVARVLIDLSGAVEWSYFLEHPPGDAAIITKLDPAAVVANQWKLVPQTMVIGADGRVKGVWTGELTEHKVDEIMNTLKG